VAGERIENEASSWLESRCLPVNFVLDGHHYLFAMSDVVPNCKRCGRPVIANRELYDAFEQMHWLCFHLEFEHPGDPDLPCADPSCTVWQLEVYRSKLRDVDRDPDVVLEEAVHRRYG